MIHLLFGPRVNYYSNLISVSLPVLSFVPILSPNPLLSLRSFLSLALCILSLQLLQLILIFLYPWKVLFLSITMIYWTCLARKNPTPYLHMVLTITKFLCKTVKLLRLAQSILWTELNSKFYRNTLKKTCKKVLFALPPVLVQLVPLLFSFLKRNEVG